MQNFVVPGYRPHRRVAEAEAKLCSFFTLLLGRHHPSDQPPRGHAFAAGHPAFRSRRDRDAFPQVLRHATI
jgi:hypothetical protein